MFCFRSTTPQNWEDFSRYNVDRANAEMEASRRLREAIHHTLHQTNNDMNAQHEKTDYALRKRIRDLKKAIDELQWQKQNVSSAASLIVSIKPRRVTEGPNTKII